MHYIESTFGAVALITSLIGLLPQSYKAYQTKSTDDISMVMLANYTCCSIAWIIYGYCIGAGFVVSSNIVGFASCILLISQKCYYDKAY